MAREQDPIGSMSVIELYRHALACRGYLADPSQMQAVERLQQLYEEWTSYKARRRTAMRKLLVRPPLPRGGLARRRRPAAMSAVS